MSSSFLTQKARERMETERRLTEERERESMQSVLREWEGQKVCVCVRERERERERERDHRRQHDSTDGAHFLSSDTNTQIQYVKVNTKNMKTFSQSEHMLIYSTADVNMYTHTPREYYYVNKMSSAR